MRISTWLLTAALGLTVTKALPTERHAADIDLGQDSPTPDQLHGFLSQFMAAGSVSSKPGTYAAPTPKEQSASVDRKEASEPEVKEPSKRGYGDRHKKSEYSGGSGRHDRHRDGYDDDYDHHDDYYDDHYDDHGKRGYEEEEEPYYKASLDCRFSVYPYATNPDECSEVKFKDYEPDFAYDNPYKSEAKGYCYWDFHRAKVDDGGACLCPRPKKECKEKKKQCYWHAHPNVGEEHDKKKSGGYHDKHHKDGKSPGVCIHNSERFYNLMAKLLAKRGKKDLSLQIHYSSAPARGKLPYGPHGPAVIGFGKDQPEAAYHRREPHNLQDDYGHYMSPQHSYGYEPEPYGYEPEPYGYEPEPYGYEPVPYGPTKVPHYYVQEHDYTPGASYEESQYHHLPYFVHSPYGQAMGQYGYRPEYPKYPSYGPEPEYEEDEYGFEPEYHYQPPPYHQGHQPDYYSYEPELRWPMSTVGYQLPAEAEIGSPYSEPYGLMPYPHPMPYYANPPHAYPMPYYAHPPHAYPMPNYAHPPHQCPQPAPQAYAGQEPYQQPPAAAAGDQYKQATPPQPVYQQPAPSVGGHRRAHSAPASYQQPQQAPVTSYQTQDRYTAAPSQPEHNVASAKYQAYPSL